MRVFLDLGKTPIANALVPPERTGARDPTYALRLAFCPDSLLVQLADPLPADVIFDEDYPYYSSFSPRLLAHAKAHVEDLIERRRLGADSFAIEIGSNDGYLLRNFISHGIRVLGIDPSPGPAAVAAELGVRTRVEFFGGDVAADIRRVNGRADVIVANNVLAHIPDINGFTAGIATVLAPDGLATIENPSVQNMIDSCEFDTVYHEHYAYWSTLSIKRTMARHQLHVNDVECFADLHGGTLRWYIGHEDRPTERLRVQLELEQEAGVGEWLYYRDFGNRVDGVKKKLLEMLTELRACGATIGAYGAAAKGATLLNSVGIGTDIVPWVADRNIHKQGMLMPGTRQPILNPAVVVEEQPDYLLLLAWNFADEIRSQQRSYASRGGRFIVPVPYPRILE
jgi:SAM-dependent methyltransferase